MSITSYALLKSAVGDWLNRSDLTTATSDFVQMAEGTLKRDPRVRKLTTNSAYQVSASPANLPSDFDALEALEHAGSTYYGPIQTVGHDQIEELKALYGTTGAPRWCAVVGKTQLRLAPAPDTTYTLKLAYWATLTPLSDTNTTNWLLTDHPDIYLYASLCEAAPYLKDDARLPMFQQRLERSLEELHLNTQRAMYSGTLIARPKRAIG